MADLGGTLWGIGLLLIPVILAVPVRWLFRSWLGNKAKHTRYREAVRRVLNSGSTLSKFRTALDEEARHLHISEDRQSRIETAMLTPLSIVHFIFIPGVTLSPLITLIAAPVYLLTWPLLTLCERILIKFGFLLRILKFVMSMTDWNVIGIRQPGHGSTRIDPVLVSIHRLPTPVLLGLFAYLISLYLPLNSTGIITSTIILYVILGSFTTVLTAAVTGPLVFSATAERRLIPLSTFVNERIQPIVGVGLLALTLRQMLMVIRNPELTPFESSVQFSLSVLAVLYSASLVGLAIEFGYNRRRGEFISQSFQDQVAEDIDAQLYAYVRKSGQLSLQTIGRLNQRDLAENELTFEEIAMAPSAMDDDTVRPEIPDL